MPTARSENWRIATGLQTYAAMGAVSNLTAWALQSDQDFSTPWTISHFKSKPITYPREGVLMLDSSRSSDGLLRFSWVFSYKTNGMLAYFFTQAGLNWYTAPSSIVTVNTYDKAGNPQIVQGQIGLPTLGESQVGGWLNVEYPFEGGVITHAGY